MRALRNRESRQPVTLPRPNRAQFVAFLLILVSAVMFRAPGFATRPTFWDEGARLAAAQPIAQGAILYRDIVDAGPPGAILFNAGVLAVTSDSLLAVRMAYLLLSLGALCLTGYITWRIYGPSAGLLASLLFAAGPWDVYYSYHMMSEPLMVVLALLAVAVVVDRLEDAAPGRYLLAGVVGTMAVLCKQPAVVALIALGLVQLVQIYRTGRWREPMINGIALVGGSLAVLGALSVWTGWNEVWGNWYAEMMRYSKIPTEQLHAVFQLPTVTDPRKWIDFLVLYAIRRLFIPLGLLGLVWPGGGVPASLLLRVLAIGSLGFVALLPLSYRGGFAHYLLMMEPWWIVLAAGALIRSIRSIGELTVGRRLAVALGAVTIVALSSLQVADLVDVVRQNVGLKRTLADEREVAGYVERSERPLVLANPVYYFHSGKRPPFEPMNYFALFRVAIDSLIDPPAAAALLRHVTADADLLVADEKRLALVLGAVESGELDIDLEEVAELKPVTIFQITRPSARQP